MAYLPLANIWHYKLRSVLSALGIGIGICMLVTLSGLASGTLNEVGDRWEAVDADLIVYPREWREDVTKMSGPGIADKHIQTVKDMHQAIIDRLVPVFLYPLKFAGQDQTVVGVDSDQWATLTGGRHISEGRLFDPQGQGTLWLQNELAKLQPDSVPFDLDDTEAAKHGLTEIVIDSRLAKSGHYVCGQTVNTLGRDWKIVGIVPDGAMGRVFMPRRAAQYYFSHRLDKSTLWFVKLKPGIDPDAASLAISRNRLFLEPAPLKQYRQMLEAKLGVMFRYIDAANAIAMIIASLFIMNTLYMMVLQRTREIAILKSCGASNWFILHQVLAESILLTCAGTAFGIGMSFFAAAMVAKFLPLYTVTITVKWLAIAVAISFASSILSAMYPAWRACRVNMVEALTLE